MKKLFYLSAMALSFVLTSNLDAQTRKHDFNDGKFGVFKVGKPDQSSRVNVINNRVKTVWKEADYNGTNSGRKAQFDLTNQVYWTQELWVGFSIKIDPNYMKDNTNTEAGLMQIWGHNPDKTGNHIAFVKFDSNKNALTWQHRYNGGSAESNYLIKDGIKRNKWIDIVVRIKLAKKDKGIVRVWVDGVRELNLSNQTIGWGTQNNNGQTGGYTSGFPAFGQYNYLATSASHKTYYSNNHTFNGFVNNEQRNVGYDNITVYKGSDNGFDRVDPDSSFSKSISNKEELSDTNTDSNFSAFPNPVGNELTIKLNDNSTEETSIALYAISGQKVIETKASGASVNLDVSKLNSGIYVLKINSETQNLTKRLVKL